MKHDTAPTGWPLRRAVLTIGCAVVLASAAACDEPVSSSACPSSNVPPRTSFWITSVEPAVLPTHAASFTIHLAGALPVLREGESDLFSLMFFVGTEPAGTLALDLRDADGQLTRDVEVHDFAFTSSASGPLKLVIDHESFFKDASRSELVALECAGKIVPTSAAPTVRVLESTLDWPVPEELAGAVKRTIRIELGNSGDQPIVTKGLSVEGASGFAIQGTCGDVKFGAPCTIPIEFAGTTPGVHDALLRIDADIAIDPVPLRAEVSPRVTGLDPAFHPAPTEMGGPLTTVMTSLWDDDTIVLPTHTGLLRFGASGQATVLSSTGDVVGIGRDAIAPLAYGARQSDGAWVRFDRDGAIDPSFVPSPALSPVIGPSFVVQSSGRILAFRDSVVALDRQGAVDTSYAMNGILFGTGASDGALDGAGRLYLRQPAGLLRVSVDGVPEQLSTGLPAAVTAMAADELGRMVVTDGSAFVRFDLASATESLAVPNVAKVTHMAYDDKGRLYLDFESGPSRRVSTNGLQETLPSLVAKAPVTTRVTCPPHGACWVYGSTGVESYVARLAP